MKSRSFVDRVLIHARAGTGGNGCVSFRREKFVPMGGPDGGDGGHGGSVILEGSHDENSLVRLYFNPHQTAADGGHGKGQQLHGRNGKDCIARVPCGTVVYDSEGGELLGDITGHGQRLVVARGGRGGRGNIHWKRSTHQAPMEHTPGEPGQELALRLELKIMADIGLVGFPNAGKSSLLRCVSDAHPKVAAYPFTTLNPMVGTVIYDDYRRLTVADIPGLIEGAHNGAGLGHEFLRHIERAAALVYVIDMAGVDNRRPENDFRNLRQELSQYDPGLCERPFRVVANKMDLPAAADNLADFIRETGTEPLAVSADSGEGISALRELLYALRFPAAGA